jgi:NADPH2:quinone reductase
MHAVQFDAYGDSSVLRWRDLPDPSPGPQQVAIRVSLTGVNFADILSRRGLYLSGTKLPLIPGLDCLGTVVALGRGVTGLRLGQRVAAFPDEGSYSEIAIAQAVLTYPIGPEIPDEAGGALNVLITAYNILRLAARLNPGESVLVHAAAGGVGSTAVQMARVLGAGRIFGTVGSPEKFEFARKCGADFVIDYRTENPAERILAETGGTGVDLILDSVGGDVLLNGFSALAPFGRYVIFGQASGKAATLPASELHRENRAVVGYTSGGYRRRRPEALLPAARASFDLVAKGLVQIAVGARFPLKEAWKAHDLVESRKSTGKVLLIP